MLGKTCAWKDTEACSSCSLQTLGTVPRCGAIYRKRGPSRRLIRFVVFVAHPQWFYHRGFHTDKGVRFRATARRKQDLYLTVASKLSGIAITDIYKLDGFNNRLAFRLTRSQFHSKRSSWQHSTFYHPKITNSLPVPLCVLLGIWYIQRVKKRRHASVVNLIIPGVNPQYDIMRRKWSRCKERVLDDAFATYAKNDPKKYVFWYRTNGCGRPACSSTVYSTFKANLIPLDPRQDYGIAEVRSLQYERREDGDDYLLRGSPDELRGTSTQVQTRCRTCKIEEFFPKIPRSTSETSFRYVVPVQKSQACQKTYRSFDSTDPKIVKISKKSVSDRRSDLLKKGIYRRDYPRCSELYWSDYHYPKKRRLLEWERRREIPWGNGEAEPPSKQPKKRNFNPKRRRLE